MVLIFSSPPSVPPIPPSLWSSITMQWTGADGSVWDLATGAEGVALGSGVEGLHDPTMTKFSSTSRAMPGKRHRGWRTEARDVFWPVVVYSDSSEAWQDTYGRFFRSIHPEVPGTWRVGFAGGFRELQLTGVYDRGFAHETDPHLLGWERYPVALEAAQPYWTGAPVVRGPWASPDPEDFFGAGAPPFTISKAEGFGSATIDNPGDVAAYPVWTITGPLSDVEVGVGDVLVDVGFSIGDGEVLVIDTDPRNVTATLDGDDVTAELGFQRFAPVEPGQSVPVHVEGTGGGSVSCSLTPLFFRAY